jgi:acetate---CoA ligase (ADP-forming)
MDRIPTAATASMNPAEPGPRAVYTHTQMQRLLRPRSFALVGASPNPSSFGAKTLANMVDFDGPVYLVNERYDQIDGRTCYPSLTDLPQVPDCVVIMVRRELVEAVVQQCAELGVGGAVIYASGFSETGLPERIALQQRLTALARASGLRIVGPNCIGLINFSQRFGVTFTSGLKFPEQVTGGIGIVSQSGALGLSLFQAVESGTRFSHVLTAGNSCDVDIADCVEFLAHDPDTRAIACVIEGMADPRRLIAAAQTAWEMNKPLVVYKMATGTQGAAAALTHTGSLAGSQAGYEAGFEQAGAIVVRDLEALVETAAFFAKAPPLLAPGVAVISTSGGASIMAADKAELYGVPLPQPIDAVREVLEAHVPEFGSPRNPCDVTAQVVSNPESLYACGDALASDPTFGAMVIPLVYAYDLTAPRVKVFSELARKHGKAACYVWLTQWLDGAGAREAEEDSRLALFRSMDRCFATLAAWQRREQRRAQGPRQAPRISAPEAAGAAAALLQAARDTNVTEREAKAILAQYGVPVTPEALCGSADAAVAAAERIGYPVVLKVESIDLPHKSDVGGVKLNLADAPAVRAAHAQIMASMAGLTPAPRVNGVLVQPMVASGVEIVVGGRIDPQFGALVTVGLGGVMVELLRDTITRVAPVNRQEAAAMLRSLKGARVLDGFRGQPALDMEALCDAVVRLSEFLADQAGTLVEFDVNPLVCRADGVMAVDALLIRKPVALQAPLRSADVYLKQAEALANAAGGGATRHVGQVGVIGAGTMGGGIAMSFANAGFPVLLVDTDSAALARGLDRIWNNYQISASKGKLSADDMNTRFARIRGMVGFESLGAVDLVVEAVFEDMAVKQAVFRQLDAVCRPDAILSTNTSRLDINLLAEAVSHPERVVGLHFFSPANVMRLIEVVRSDSTAADVIATAMAISHKMRKSPVLVGVCDGFVGNRMLTPYLREVGFLLEEGASPTQVDRALRDFGMAMGPLTVSDMAGLDIPWAARKRNAAQRDPAVRYSRIADRLCEAGRFGLKTGAGYYRYESGSRTPLPDPEVDALIEACARESGITRAPVSDALVIERTMFALINEAARIVAEGIVERASDVDVVYVRGYGFPAALGGPLRYADSLGLDHVLERIRAFEAAHGSTWTPAPLLAQLARDGGRFTEP